MVMDPENIRDRMATAPFPLIHGIDEAHSVLLIHQELMLHIRGRHFEESHCQSLNHLQGIDARLISYITMLEATLEIIDERTGAEHGWSTFEELIPPAPASKSKEN